MKTALPFILVFIISCKQSITPKINIFTINNAYNFKEDSIRKGLLDGPPWPPITFYYRHHLIIDSSGQIYYYQLPSKLIGCGTGDYNYEVPEYIGLKPNDLVRVPEKSVPDFIKLNILNQEQDINILIAGLQKDTIISVGLTRLQDTLIAQKSRTFLYFRKATQEETIVLNYKKSNEYYIPEEINWDTTRIWFYMKKLDSSYIKFIKDQ